MSGAYPEALTEFMEFLRSLPGIGKRSAERMALAVYEWDEEKLSAFAHLAGSLKQRIGRCPECGGMSSAPGEKCAICSSSLRDPSLICVVEDFPQLRSIEAGGTFKGHYHILGGHLAPLEGKLADSLTVDPLLRKVESGTVREVILALSPDMEGQATAVYLAGLLQGKNIKISRPAQGLPAGSDLSYADPATIAAALSGRTDFKN